MKKVAAFLKRLFHRAPTDEQLAIGTIYRGLNTNTTHVIALARLLFIKPETLVREAQNVKANADYLLKMVEAKKKEQV